MFDIGVNLTSGQLLPRAREVLERAHRAGVTAMAITGTNLAESREAVSLCESLAVDFGGILCATAGVHPHHADQWSDSCAEGILQLAGRTAIRAIGETGLDYNRKFSSPDLQRRAFEAQLEIAATTGLPLFLHERDAFTDQIALLRQHRAHFSTAVAHCFTGTREQLHAYLDLDFYIGITGWICDERRGQNLAHIVHEIPADRLLVETDAPWLLPRNMEPRPESRRNEPAYLGWVVRKIAECRDEATEQIATLTRDNAREFFAILD